MDRDARAFPRQAQRNPAADAFRRAGYQHHAPG
jgi:hypothetical protein